MILRTSCETLRLSTFGSSCEKLAKLHSPFQMARQKVKTKLSWPNTLLPKGSGNFRHFLSDHVCEMES